MKEFFGLLGEKLGHSISPEIHNRIFEELNIEGSYNIFQVKSESLEDAVIGLKALGAKGVNVTIPYKVQVMKYLDSISEEALKIGAVNTICFDGLKTIGYNTDYYGFGMLIDKFDIDLIGKKAVVLGTGGASKSVIQYLRDNGINAVMSVSRNPNKDEKDIISYNELADLENYDLIINCTPSGMFPNIDSSPVDKKVISKFSAAVDLIYNPSQTLFLKYAQECGIKAVNGLYMLVGQATVAEELWHGIKIDKQIIDKIYETMVV